MFQFSLRMILATPCIVLIVLFLVKERVKHQHLGWSGCSMHTNANERLVVTTGALGVRNDSEARFGYVVVDTNSSEPPRHPPKGLVSDYWGKTFAGRRLVWLDDVFYLAFCKDGELLFFDKIDDPWIRHKFSEQGQISKDDIETIADLVGVQLNIDLGKLR